MMESVYVIYTGHHRRRRRRRTRTPERLHVVCEFYLKSMENEIRQLFCVSCCGTCFSNQQSRSDTKTDEEQVVLVLDSQHLDVLLR